MLENLKLSILRNEIEFRSRAFLPENKGSTFRGSFGHAFKNVVCSFREKECKECMLKDKCVYCYVFETIPPKNSEIMTKYTNAPHPFIFDTDIDKNREFNKGEIFKFNITLIGKAVDILPYFIYSFRKMGETGIGKEKSRFILKKTFSVFENNERLVYQDIDKTFNNEPIEIKKDDIFDSLKFNNNKIKIKYITPVRVKYNGKYTENLDFHILIRNLLRRLSLISYFHLDEKMNVDFKGIISDSEKVRIISSDLKWTDWTRYSNRQKTKMKLGGVVGEAIYEGRLEPFKEILKLGEFIHIGHGASFGNGKYEILNV